MTVHLAASVAIMRPSQVLLVQREDFLVWELPGGDVDPGESVGQAAVREAREETGLDVELTGLIGLYSLVGGEHSLVVALFAARAIGGKLAPDPDEIADAAWFGPDDLPQDLIWWHKQRIADAFAGVRGAVWKQTGGWPFPPHFTRRELYALRDSLGLSRAQAFRQLFPEPKRAGASGRETQR